MVQERIPSKVYGPHRKQMKNQGVGWGVRERRGFKNEQGEKKKKDTRHGEAVG